LVLTAPKDIQEVEKFLLLKVMVDMGKLHEVATESEEAHTAVADHNVVEAADKATSSCSSRRS
jgi:hypothetical protein